jgi:ADP-ribose pyrophosphatase YjhB (NUDIX family)
MKKPTFTNRPNKPHKTDDGTIWHSRSAAVVCSVVLSVQQQLSRKESRYILLGKRGDAADYKGKWNIPCGYFDWQENLRHAFRREVWEETGINIDELAEENQMLIDSTDQPWSVNTEPDENLQNITLHGFIMIRTSSLPETSLDNMEKNESVEARWFKLEDALEIKKEDWAFNHYDRLRILIKHFDLRPQI